LELDKNILLRNAQCNPTPDETLKRSKNELEIGVSCLFLRSVTSCFQITAKDQKELAISTWNAQWDVLLLSAILNTEIGFNFESDVKPDDIEKAEYFRVSNYHLKGLISGKPYNLKKSDYKWLENYFKSAKNLMDLDAYNNAVHCLFSYRWHSMSRVQLVILWSGIEGLFGIDYELSFRLSLYISKYLSPRNKAKQKEIFDTIKSLYRTRSKAIHGAKLKKGEEAVSLSVSFLHKLIRKCAETGHLPIVEELVP